jgi:hypothetical protein
MEDVYNLCNVIDEQKLPRQKNESLLAFSSSKWIWHNHIKTHSHVYVNIQIPQLLKGRIDQ